MKDKKDLVVTHVQDEDRFVRILEQKYGLEVPAMSLCTDVAPPGEVRERPMLCCNTPPARWRWAETPTHVSHIQRITLVGHDFTKAGEKEVFLPCSLQGDVLYPSKSKYIVKTLGPSVMGMCGGPVLLGDPETSTTTIGMVEALVTVNNPGSDYTTPADPKTSEALESLNGQTLVLGASEIAEFLPTVELEMDIVQPSRSSEYSDDF